ncbi:MAG TPA: medium chain dehydrogenase/reductase family protein [Polyangiaceae bacterium]|nr:medium chain dehydrogenase/reductase family protein [Polyangiaceae bacterium]
MKLISIAKPGSFDRLRLVDAAEPRLAPGEVRVQTRAVGVNFADVVIRLGLYESAKKYVGWPITPGFEISGEVLELGPGVSDLQVGERVFGLTRFGGYASQVCVPRAQLFRVPAAWSHAQAATFPTVHLTAYYALRQVLRTRPGESVLVHSAAGGVGLAALQVARADGLSAIGLVGSSHKRDVALAYGAAHVIDKSTQALWPEVERLVPGGLSYVLESNGAETLKASYQHLKPTGRLIVYGFTSMLSRGRGRPNWLKLAWDYLRTPRFHPLQLVDANKGVIGFNLSYLFEEQALLSEAMGRMLAEVESGALRPLPVSEFPLADAGRAHEALQSGTTVGKLALVP